MDTENVDTEDVDVAEPYSYDDLVSAVGPNLFPQYEYETRRTLYNLMKIIQSASHRAPRIIGIIAIFGIVINIVHLIILVRKPMRNNSIAVFLIFLATSEILSMTSMAVYGLKSDRFENTDCVRPDVLLQTSISYALISLRRLFARFISWIVILMAIVRLVVVKFADDSRFRVIGTPRFAIKASIHLFLFCCVFSIPATYSYDIQFSEIWEPKSHCVGYPPNYFVPQFVIRNIGEDENESTTAVDEFSTNIMPCILCPILIKMLVSATRKMKKKNKNHDEGKKYDTKLVVAITTVLLTTEYPQAIAHVIKPFVARTQGLVVIFRSNDVILPILTVIYGCTHFLICIAICPDYRKALKSIFCGGQDTRAHRVDSLIGATEDGPTSHGTARPSSNLTSSR